MALTCRATGGGLRNANLEEVQRALCVLADPASGIQLQYAPFHADSWETFPGTDIEGMTAWVKSHEDAKGVYYVHNPVPHTLDHSALVPDIIKRHLLFIDVDRDKTIEPKNSATDAEHERAFQLARRIKEYLQDSHWPAPVFVDSGNGWQILYKINLPNTGGRNDLSRQLVKSVLDSLAFRFSSTDGSVDSSTCDARRLAKLPGTWACRGERSEERPWRMAKLIEVPAFFEAVDPELMRETVAKLRERSSGTTAATSSNSADAPNTFSYTAPESVGPSDPTPAPDQASEDTPRPNLIVTATNGEDERLKAYARSAFERELGALAAAPEGNRNNQYNESAFAIGQLVGADWSGIGRADAEASLRLIGERIGLEAGEIETTLRSGLEAGLKQPREAPSESQTKSSRHSQRSAYQPDIHEPPDVDADDVATIHDLIRAGAQVTWAWKDWLQSGVLTAIAAQGGTGKTRFCADLVRRVRHQLAWPDGQAMTLPADSLALWVVSDNHHDEMVDLAKSFDIVDSIRLNATKADPYGGVTLESDDDYRGLESRIKAVRPAFVIIDTVGNATDKNLSKQEDAKAFYWPLQIIARKYRTLILCLTHLNAGGQFLGRRVMEKVRVAIRMDKYEGEERRRLEVTKTNSKKPPALGVTMGEDGNDYDDNPPEPPSDERPGKAAISPKLQEAMDWLRAYLESGPKRVRYTRTAAEAAGISAPTLYKARDMIHAEESETEGYKWWSLAPTTPPGG